MGAPSLAADASADLGRVTLAKVGWRLLPFLLLLYVVAWIDRVNISVGEGGARAGLKPGESLDRGTGEVRDVLGNGEIRVHRQER